MTPVPLVTQLNWLQFVWFHWRIKITMIKNINSLYWFLSVCWDPPSCAVLCHTNSSTLKVAFELKRFHFSLTELWKSSRLSCKCLYSHRDAGEPLNAGHHPILTKFRIHCWQWWITWRRQAMGHGFVRCNVSGTVCEDWRVEYKVKTHKILKCVYLRKQHYFSIIICSVTTQIFSTLFWTHTVHNYIIQHDVSIIYLFQQKLSSISFHCFITLSTLSG